MSRIILSEQPGRKLVQISDADWERLPKDLTGLPVYYRRTATGIEWWPRYSTEPEIWENVWVSP